MGGLLQTPIRGARGSTALSRPLYPSGRHLQPPPGLARRQRRHLQVEGLPRRRSRAIRRDDARYPRVHPPLPDACVAARLPPHPTLRRAPRRFPTGHGSPPSIAPSTTHQPRRSAATPPPPDQKNAWPQSCNAIPTALPTSLSTSAVARPPPNPHS